MAVSCGAWRSSLRVRPFSSSSSSARGVVVHARSSLESGCIDYAKGWAWQYLLLHQRLAQRRRLETSFEDDVDTILFLEHNPVYTLGRGADEHHLTFLQKYPPELALLSRKNHRGSAARLAVNSTAWFEQEILPLAKDEHEAVARLSQVATPVVCPPNGTPIYRVERGGEVTFHGPGQLVVYPLFDLQRDPFRKDLHWFLRQLEEAILMTLKEEYDIHGSRDESHSGVWVGYDKIAAIGVSSARWITNHGFSMNVSPDLSYFDSSQILPCGIGDGRGITSIAQILQQRGDEKTKLPSVQDVANSIRTSMETVFHIQIDDCESHRPLV